MNRTQIFFSKKWKNVIISRPQHDRRTSPFSSGRPAARTCVSMPLCHCVTCLHSCLSAFQGFASSEAVSARGFLGFLLFSKERFSHPIYHVPFFGFFKKSRQLLNFLGCRSPHHVFPGTTQVQELTQLDVTQRYAN